MRRYSAAVKADIRKRMSPPARQSVARISEETGIHICTLYAWRKGWRLEGEVVPASRKDPECWSAADKFTVVLESAGLNATELSAYCRERGLYPEQVERWWQASQDANEKLVLTLKEQRELEILDGAASSPFKTPAGVPLMAVVVVATAARAVRATCRTA